MGTGFGFNTRLILLIWRKLCGKLSDTVWSACSLYSLVSILILFVSEQNLNKKGNSGRGLRWSLQLELWFAMLCLYAWTAAIQFSLERKTDNMQPLFWEARPTGMAAPKTASDGLWTWGIFWCASQNLGREFRTQNNRIARFALLQLTKTWLQDRKSLWNYFTTS